MRRTDFQSFGVEGFAPKVAVSRKWHDSSEEGCIKDAKLHKWVGLKRDFKQN